jgi:hypothetical protein
VVPEGASGVEGCATAHRPGDTGALYRRLLHAATIRP